MTQRLEFYKCQVCGNLVEILNSGVGELVCCSQPMNLLIPHTTEDQYMNDHHLPVIEESEDGEKLIRIGSTQHDMSEEHHIEFIETISKDQKNVHLKFLDLGERPIIDYKCRTRTNTARCHCNKHGLWEGELD